MADISPDSPEFDFVRYFDRVQRSPFWHKMQIGMVEFAHVQAGQMVLDVGSGNGRLVSHLRQQGIFAIGADADKRMAQHATQTYSDLPYAISMAHPLPFADHCFDVVTAANLLFFLPDPLTTLKEMARVTKPHGWVVIWNPSETMNQQTATAYANSHPELDAFEQKHVVNWSGVAERNRRWNADDLQQLFAQARLQQFATQTTLSGLARYAKGQVAITSPF